jgi:hypothetical protein
LPADSNAVAVNSAEIESERSFLESWCDELLARAWAALAAVEEETGQPLHTVLRWRADHPEMRSPQMAKELTDLLKRQCTSTGIRQTLHRARERFADFLLDEVAQSLENPTADEVGQELVELGMLEYCRPALERYSLKT